MDKYDRYIGKLKARHPAADFHALYQRIEKRINQPIVPLNRRPLVYITAFAMLFLLAVPLFRNFSLLQGNDSDILSFIIQSEKANGQTPVDFILND